MIYMIWNDELNLFWSRTWGWVGSGASMYTQEGKEKTTLPKGGAWFNLTVATEPVIIDNTKGK